MRCGSKTPTEGSRPAVTRLDLKEEMQEQLDAFRRQVVEDIGARLQDVLSMPDKPPPPWLGKTRKESDTLARPPDLTSPEHCADDEDLAEITKKGFRKNIETSAAAAMESMIQSRSRGEYSRVSGEEDLLLVASQDNQGALQMRQQLAQDPGRSWLEENEAPFSSSRQLCCAGQTGWPGESLMPRIKGFMESDSFGYVITALVMVNAILIGFQTDYTARRGGGGKMPGSKLLGQIFCYVFTAEVAMRIVVSGCRDFFTGSDWRWNIFDFLVVGLQWAEEVVDAISAGTGQGHVLNLGFLRILRTLRVVRIMRLARVLHLVVELRTMVSSIVASLKPLFWATLLFSMLIYAVAVAMTQMANEFRAENGEVDTELNRYFSSLGTAVLALWECISGGMDWQDLAQPMIEDISPLMGVFFSAYVAFSVLAMMNVITGIFVDNAKTYAQHDKDTYVVRHVLNLFKQTDLGEVSAIDWIDFQAKLDTRELQELFAAVEVDVADARSLFKLIDTDNSGSVTPDELMRGWLRLQGPAKALDLSLLLRDSTRNFDSIQRQLHDLRVAVSWLLRSMEASLFPDDPTSPRLECRVIVWQNVWHAPVDLLNEPVRSFALTPDPGPDSRKGRLQPPSPVGWTSPPVPASRHSGFGLFPERGDETHSYKYQVLPQS
ncbi:CAC [Symbiodinium natans]|uniref:CAC protein n=1 Tax=Symbiodinium natans TaxID=878477 RepID=A0A812RW51_9DINO|nr:CAC [Symbiodinium natans]